MHREVREELLDLQARAASGKSGVYAVFQPVRLYNSRRGSDMPLKAVKAGFG